MPLEPGTTLGSYSVTAKIGEGGMGEVSTPRSRHPHSSARQSMCPMTSKVDAKVELIRSLIPLGLMHIEELLDEEVTALAGERYARKDPSVGGRSLAIQASATKLRELQERDPGPRAGRQDVLARWLSCRGRTSRCDPVPPVLGRAGPRCLPGAAGDRRWRLRRATRQDVTALPS